MFAVVFGLTLIFGVLCKNPIHDFQGSFNYPFFYPPDSNVIPGFQLIGQAAVVKNEHSLRLASDTQDSVGAVWSSNSNKYANWRVQLQLRFSTDKVTGGDGLAIWYSKDAGKTGQAFGSVAKWTGLGIMLDTIQDASKAGQTAINLVMNDNSFDYSMHNPKDPHVLASCVKDLHSSIGKTSLRITYFNKTLTVEVDTYEYGRDFQPCFEKSNIDLPTGYFFGISASSRTDPQKHDIYSFDLFEMSLNPKPVAPEKIAPEIKKKHEELLSKFETSAHKREEHARFDEPRFNSKIMELVARIQDLEVNMNDYLRESIGVSKDGLTVLQKLNDMDERLKVFTDHVNLLTTALNKLSGTQSGDKTNIQKILSDLKTESEKRFSNLEEHAIASQNTSTELHKAVQSTASSSTVFMIVLFVSFQLLLVIAFFWYKKSQDSYRKLL